ncbi:MAG: histidinol-phosphatase [Bacteroidetes bacterium]|nr:histidinol-phosphatase [Bacteroidota bacterium]MBU1717766.1 histidinol-phosphatase [Bacteroidota bacterium]
MKQKKGWVNYHTHTQFCDGQADPIRYMEAAIKSGLLHLGFSAHAPVPFENEWSIKNTDMPLYCRHIRQLSDTFHDDIRVFLALEADFIPEVSTDFDLFKQEYDLDYVIGGIHLIKRRGKDGLWFIDGPGQNYDLGLEKVFNNDIRMAVGHFFDQSREMVNTQKFDIIAHFDKITMNNSGRFFTTEEKWYQRHLLNLVQDLANKQIIVEVNTRGKYKKRSSGFFPDLNALELCKRYKVPVTISTDAHLPEEIDLLIEEAAEMLYEIGFRELAVFSGKKWELKSFTPEGIIF